MPRPIKSRRIEFIPENTGFMPLEKRCGLREIILKVEELEAMRLKDIEGLSQEECAEKMMISRQTFQNIIDSARKKVATALIEGTLLRVHGGHYTMPHCKFKCRSCGNLYDIQYEQDKRICPICGDDRVDCSKKKDCCQRNRG
ncbi:MAG: DUF134 domain-containing protein [Thermotaleaceae bacterium]